MGTRVGSPEAKEMMLRGRGAQNDGQPLISYALDCAQFFDILPHALVRQEKRGLIAYLEGRRCSVQVVTPTREWPETILCSKNYWREYNVVCLPDTDFLPSDVVGKMLELLERDADAVFATHQVSDYSTWGVIRKEGEVYSHCEKPTDTIFNFHSTRAWGLFGFRRDYGELLLQQMLDSTFDHKWRKLPGNIKLISLDFFNDLTRG